MGLYHQRTRTLVVQAHAMFRGGVPSRVHAVARGYVFPENTINLVVSRTNMNRNRGQTESVIQRWGHRIIIDRAHLYLSPYLQT